MTVWIVGQQVSLNRNSVVTIDRVTPSGWAFVGYRQYNSDGRERAGNHWQHGIEPLTPELVEQIALAGRYRKARTLMYHAARDLNAWATEYCFFNTERVPDLAEIEQIERVAAAAGGAVQVAFAPIKDEVAP